MPNMNDTVAPPRQVLPIIYVLDTSGSMTGAPISQLNQGMVETFEVLKEQAQKNTDAEVKVAVLEFNSKASWIFDKLVSYEDFFWNDLKAGGATELATMLDELNSKLSRKALLQSNTGFKLPIIIFMSDGEPTDPGIWEKKLDAVKSNKWFLHAIKIAIALGDDADRVSLAKLVGSSERVVSVTDLDTFKKLLKVVTVTSSFIGSKSQTVSAGDQADEIVKEAVKEIEQDDGGQVETGLKNGQQYKDPDPEPTGNDWTDEGWD